VFKHINSENYNQNKRRNAMTKLILNLLLTLSLTSAVCAGNYSLDKAHSNVSFEVTHMVITTVTGNFTAFDVDLNWDPEDLANSSVQANIKISSVNTDNEKRDTHLKSADFFDAAQYPEMVFKSKKIEATDNGFKAYGTLTMRGVSKDIELPFEILGPIKGPWGNERIGVSASTKINRQDWGVSYGSVMDNGGLVVSDDVIVKINGQFIKNQEKGLSNK